MTSTNDGLYVEMSGADLRRNSDKVSNLRLQVLVSYQQFRVYHCFLFLGKVSRENQGLALKRPDSLREVPERRSDEDVNSCWGKFSQKRRVNLYIHRGEGPIKTTPLIQYNLPSSTENLTRKTEKNNT